MCIIQCYILENRFYTEVKYYLNNNTTPQHLGRVIKINNITRKRTRDQHFPKEHANNLSIKIKN